MCVCVCVCAVCKYMYVLCTSVSRAWSARHVRLGMYVCVFLYTCVCCSRVFIVVMRKTVSLLFFPFALVLFGKVAKDVSAGQRFVLYVNEYVWFLIGARAMYVWFCLAVCCECVCVCVYGCVFFFFLFCSCFLSFLYSYMLLESKCSFVSKTAAELARSSSVDVLHVSLGVYALSSIVVSENRIKADRKLLPT